MADETYEYKIEKVDAVLNYLLLVIFFLLARGEPELLFYLDYSNMTLKQESKG